MSSWGKEGRSLNDEKALEPPWVDPIVAEVRGARATLLAAAGFDLERLAQRLREEQAVSGHPVVTLPPRQPGHGSGEAA